MKFIQSDKLSNSFESIIHEDTQVHNDHLDLTVGAVHRLTEAGSLDFGGSEFQPAQARNMEPQKKSKNDDYGWWHLPKGCYKAILNEEIRNLEDAVPFMAPHQHAREAGIIANTQIISAIEDGEPLTFNFWVPKAGCNIKENARIAVIYLLVK